MAKPGPKNRYTKEYVEKLADELIEYAKTDPLPFLKKFAADRLIPSQKFSDTLAFTENEKFMAAKRIALDLIEHKVWTLGCLEKINPTMAIFTLKNLGWRDQDSDRPIDNSIHYHLHKLDDKTLIEKLRSQGCNLPVGIESRIG